MGSNDSSSSPTRNIFPLLILTPKTEKTAFRAEDGLVSLLDAFPPSPQIDEPFYGLRRGFVKEC